MKIKAINLYRLELPVADRENGYTYGGGTFFKQDAVISEVICDNGMTGWGEHTTISGVYVESCWETTLAAITTISRLQNPAPVPRWRTAA